MPSRISTHIYEKCKIQAWRHVFKITYAITVIAQRIINLKMENEKLVSISSLKLKFRSKKDLYSVMKDQSKILSLSKLSQ